MSHKVIAHTLSADVDTSETIVLAFPAGTNEGTFLLGREHKIVAQGTVFEAPEDFTVAVAQATGITVTWLNAVSLLEGDDILVQIDASGGERAAVLGHDGKAISGVSRGELVYVNLGAPATADADGISVSASIAEDGSAVIGGALASGGVATFDVPRNVVGAWTTSAKATVTGTDKDGNVLVEETASAGTSHTGKKAFKTVTSIVMDTAVTGATFGSGDVLGLPFFLPKTGVVLKELQDGAAATAGTVVAGAAAVATATTGDVRGTYDPNAAADGDKMFGLLVFGADPTDNGAPQYAG